MIKIILFLISYIPLYIGLLLKNIAFYYYNFHYKKSNISNVQRLIKAINLFWHKDTAIFLINICLVFVPLLLFLLFLLLKSKQQRYSWELAQNYKKTGDNIINYLITYVIPFFSMPIRSLSLYSWGNLILIGVIMILFVKLDMVYLNPPLILIGFYIFTDEDEEKYYLTRNTFSQLKVAKTANDYIRVMRITSNFYYIKKIDFGSA